MLLIRFLLNLVAITGNIVWANQLNAASLILSPSDRNVVRYTNESLIVQCRSPKPNVKFHWKSPKGEIIHKHKGRIHIEQTTPDQLKIVFTRISLSDKGNWSCEDADGVLGSKGFDLIVYQKITFTENSTTLTVKDGNKATILCEVEGEPQPNVTWHFNGQPINIDTNSTKFRILADGLLINKVTQNDTGEYTCRAYQVNSIASDMQERTVLMKIEHKPHWTYSNHLKHQYAYLNGTVTISCEAIAEPPANFTWYRNKKRLHKNKYYNITTDNYWSMLTINVGNESVYDNYRCRVENSLGSIERTTALQQGTKPPPPSIFQLRDANSNTFNVDVGFMSSPQIERNPMEVNSFRIEYMSEYEFRSDAGKWTNAKLKDFSSEDGDTFLISNLQPNTTYLMRAASRNLAGFSDWTKIEKFRTLSIELSSSATTPAATPFKMVHLFFVIMLALFHYDCKQQLKFGFFQSL